MRIPLVAAMAVLVSAVSVFADDSAKDALLKAAGGAQVSVPAAHASPASNAQPLGDDMAGVMGVIGTMSGAPMACYGVDELHLQEAVTKAHELAASCLVADGKGLNPALGRKVLDSGGKSATFHCKYTLADAQAVTSSSGDRPDIKVKVDANSRPKEETSSQEMRYIDLTVFHELLHAVDPDGKLMYSLYAHNEGGPFPDAVYGCEFACAGNWNGYDSVLGRMAVFETLVAPIPQLESYACPEGSGGACQSLKKFAWLCAHGPIDLGSDEKQAQNLFEDAICLRKNGSELIERRKDYPLGQETYDAGLEALKYGEANGLSKSDPAVEAKLLAGMAGVVIHAMKADLMDKVRFAAFLKKHDCPSLP